MILNDPQLIRNADSIILWITVWFLISEEQ